MKATQRQRAGRVSGRAARTDAGDGAGPAPGSAPGRLPARAAVIAILLIALTVVAFWPVTRAEFLNYDDHDYVSENPRVLSGLNWDNVVWAFTTTLTSNWHPLTWLSHMLDCTLFGARPGWHHAMNLAIHALNTALLFLVLWRLTAREATAPASRSAGRGETATAQVKDFPLWASAFVAALFAVHPLHVESVAWVSERKDVLSGFFFCLSLWAYARYAERRSRLADQGSSGSGPIAAAAPRLTGLQTRRAALDYGLAVTFFALGLMSKPMLVTLPFVLLLLDYWPLRRLNPTVSVRAVWPLVREKLPFFALTVVSCVVTFLAQHRGGSVQTLDAFPLSARIENALVSYARYLARTFWPVNLANPYPHPGDWPGAWVLGSAVLVAALCFGAIWWGWRYRPLFVGWFWFWGMLIPVIGLVQVGAQSMADRYTYLPLIGVFLAVTWSVGEVAQRRPGLRKWLAPAALLIVGSCAFRTADQARLWRNSGTLFSHAVAVTERNDIAWANLGNYYIETGRLEAAVEALQNALQCAQVPERAGPSVRVALSPVGAEAVSAETLVRIDPRRMVACAEVLNNLGTALSRLGRPEAAMQCFRAALELKPEHAFALHNLAAELAAQQRHSEALSLLERAVRARPDHPELRVALGNGLMQLGRTDEAIAQYREALRLAPRDADAHHALGMALAEQRQLSEAVKHFEAALRANPNLVEARNSLGSALLQAGKTDEAIRQFEAVLKSAPQHPRAHDNLGVALASLGRLDEAIAHLREAARLEPNNAGTRLNLGNVLAMKRDLPGAVDAFREALRLSPDFAQAHCHLAAALAELGHREEAVRHLREALRLEPDYAEAKEQLRQLGASPGEP